MSAQTMPLGPIPSAAPYRAPVTCRDVERH